MLSENYNPETPKKTSLGQERKASLVTPEEAEATIADVEKAKKASRGIMQGEFNDWWLGKGEREGAKKLAGWIFNKLAESRELFGPWQEGRISREEFGTSRSDFFSAVEPNLKRLIEETAKHGGQEHIVQYFWEEWAPGYDKEAKEKIWKIYQKYLNDLGGKV